MSDALNTLPPTLAQRVAGELQPGEAVRWAGVPGWFSSALPTLPLFVFGIAWSSLTFSFEGAAVASILAPGAPSSMGTGMGILFLIFGLPFVAVGVVLLGLPFFEATRALMTAHVVTDRRLITVHGGPWRSVEIRPVAALTFVVRRDHDDQRGTLRLGFGVEVDGDGDPRSVQVSWRGVPAVRAAEDAVRALAAQAGRVV
ncbi:hypothetical protein [uncultured Alsobacter sp.]|uniref:hypothetical protein n=1 Tax=uncultured Alsobacter sp. TaxID=1748258 RepID=UPI0025E286AD|nr:hypothetical protein [uncultured Alsobacter sp.]